MAALICWLSERVAVFLSLALTFGHCYGAGGWIAIYHGFFFLTVLCGAAAIIFILALESWNARRVVQPTWWECGSLALLFCPAAAVLMLVPPPPQPTYAIVAVNRGNQTYRVLIDLDGTIYGTELNVGEHRTILCGWDCRSVRWVAVEHGLQIDRRDVTATVEPGNAFVISVSADGSVDTDLMPNRHLVGFSIEEDWQSDSSG
jgi:hypothetical protein